jgi:uncharacterized protein YndB with AHSA1/START domain
MEGKYNISASHDYTNSPEKIYSLIRDGKLFKLTGADKITYDFSVNAAFEFDFANRGKISGRFLKIIPNSKVIMEWDVEGFDRPAEKGTKVWITILGDEKRTTPTIEHREIPTEQSAEVKRRAWEEILDDLK